MTQRSKTQNPVSSIEFKKKIFPNQISIYIGLCHNWFFDKIFRKFDEFLTQYSSKISLIYTRKIHYSRIFPQKNYKLSQKKVTSYNDCKILNTNTLLIESQIEC